MRQEATRDNKGKQRREILKSYLAVVAVLAAAVILLLVFPDRRQAAVATAWRYFAEMILILPAVMVLMGLFSVFVSKEAVVRYLGKAAGLKGLLLALLLGSLPTGPLYVAFPLAAALRAKGARSSAIVVFLSAWACIKIPQELVELQFLGFRFMATRLALTVVFVVLMGLFIERLIEWTDRRGWGISRTGKEKEKAP